MGILHLVLIEKLGQFWQGPFGGLCLGFGILDSSVKDSRLNVKLGTVVAGALDWAEKLGQFWQGSFRTWDS